MKKSSIIFSELFEQIHNDNQKPQNCSNVFRKSQGSAKMQTSDHSFRNRLSVAKVTKFQGSLEGFDTIRNVRKSQVYKTTITLRKKESQQMLQFGVEIKLIEKQMIKFLQRKTKSEVQQIIDDLKKIDCLLRQSLNNKQNALFLFAKFYEQISKLISHKISRIIFKLSYCQLLHFDSRSNSIETQKKLLNICQQYGRIFGMSNLSLYSCKRLVHIFMQSKDYEQAKIYSRKSVRLAVLLKNVDEQYRAIQMLKLINFYQGAVGNTQNSYLTKRQKDFIEKNYRLSDEVYETNKQNKNLQTTKYKAQQIDFEQQKKLSKNLQNFVCNLAFMNNDLSQRSRNVMNTVKRVGKVGSVRKYRPDGSSICFQPRSSAIPTEHRGQVFLTHKKRKQQRQGTFCFFRNYMPKIRQMLQNLILIKIH